MQVTSRKDQEQYWTHKDQPYSFVTAKEFSESFQLSHIGRKLGEELETPFNKAKSHPAALKTEKYGARKKELLEACISREYLLMKRNSFVYIFKLTQVSLIIFLTYNHVFFFFFLYINNLLFLFLLLAHSNGNDHNDNLPKN